MIRTMFNGWSKSDSRCPLKQPYSMNSGTVSFLPMNHTRKTNEPKEMKLWKPRTKEHQCDQRKGEEKKTFFPFFRNLRHGELCIMLFLRILFRLIFKRKAKNIFRTILLWLEHWTWINRTVWLAYIKIYTHIMDAKSNHYRMGLSALLYKW